MIGSLQGEIVFSDGNQAIVSTASGIGYQVFTTKVYREGENVFFFISQIIRETSQDLFGFNNLKEKKLFEALLSVKGVGPKSAYSLISNLKVDQIIQAITFEDKKILSSVPGIGPKAAAQIILDLSQKIKKVMMYSYGINSKSEKYIETSFEPQNHILEQAIMACKELGFKESEVLSKAQRILLDHAISKPEQLVHLVLKEI